MISEQSPDLPLQAIHKVVGETLFTGLTAEDFEEAVEVAAQAFVLDNSLWKSLGVTVESAKEYFRQMLSGYRVPETVIVKSRGKIVSLVVSKDAFDYVTKKNLVAPEHQPFSLIKKYSNAMEYFAFLNVSREREVVFLSWGVVDIKLMGAGLGLLVTLQSLKHWRQMGYKYVLSRCTHPSSMMILLKLGGWVLEHVDMGGSDSRLEGLPMWMVCVPLERPFSPLQRKERAAL